MLEYDRFKELFSSWSLPHMNATLRSVCGRQRRHSLISEETVPPGGEGW